ncbi:MAG TPA: sugar phosphate nucleotidyltransferase, partial [Gemmatimonadaceae bacterium]
IIPLAGKGTRLRPHTHLVPKPMLKIAGKPVIDYVVDDLKKLGGVEEVIYITGHLKDKVEEYVRTHTPWKAVFIEQARQLGTADAIGLAKAHVDQPVMVIFVDTIFDADLSLIPRCTGDGIIWVKTVEDYQRFGVVVADANGHMQKIVEKPKTPVSKRANIGLYYLKNWKLLYEGIDHVMKQPPNQGEYYLTDAFQYMVDKGAKLDVVDVEGWYDAGKIDTLLETNRIMLEKRKMARRPRDLGADATVIEPVYIEDGVTIRRSTVGPNVSIGKGTVVEDSTLRDTIVGDKGIIARSHIHGSLIGDEAVIRGFRGHMTLGNHGELSGETG